MDLKTEETICAQSTPQGIGAISLIRISGRKALTLTKKICPFLPKNPKSHRIYYGWVTLPSNEKLDEVLVSYFEKGKSFTGEESLELSCHGNPNIVKELLEILILKGARLARRGEFTYRAFMNGRIDLVQAEGLLGLIRSQNRTAKKAYLNQLEGSLSKQIREIIHELQGLHAHVEADIDFSEENLEIKPMKILRDETHLVLLKINQLLDSFQKGRFLREGLKVFLIGPPNVGKSTLFNALLGKDQAIVTKTPGTTRDLLEGRLYMDDQEGLLCDTAGLREAKEEIEKIGVKKVKKAILNQEGLFLFILDLSKPITKKDLLPFQEFKALNPKNTFIVGNKLDLIDLKPLKNPHPLNRNSSTAKKHFISSNSKTLKEEQTLFKRIQKNSVESLKSKFHQALKSLSESEDKSHKSTKNNSKIKEEKQTNTVQKGKKTKDKKKISWPHQNFLTLSAKKELSLSDLKKRLKKFFLEERQKAFTPLTEVRHYELLLRSKKHLKKTLKQMEEDEALDLIAFELKESLLPLYELLGEEWNEQLMDRIFKEFCLGK